MKKNTLAICLIFLVASSIIYEVQGTFLLRLYLRRKLFPRRCMDFTPYACKGMLMLVSNLQNVCPVTSEFKQFFTNIQGYVSFINSATATSANIISQMTTQCDGIAKALSVLTGAKESSDFKATMLSMGKTLIEMKQSGSLILTASQKKELIMAMMKWTRMVVIFVQTASEKEGKSVDVSSYGLDVDVNSYVEGESDSGSDESTPSGSSSPTRGSQKGISTKVGSETSTNTGSGSATSEKAESSSGTSSVASVQQVQTETSKEVMSFVTELEKKYSGKAELSVFFAKLKASMTAFSGVSSKSATDYVSVAKSAASKLAEVMTFISSKSGKSEKIESCQGQVMKSLKELQDINSQIVSEKKVSSTQKTEIKQTISKFEQVTTEFVEVAASSSSSSSSSQSSSKQSNASFGLST